MSPVVPLRNRSVLPEAPTVRTPDVGNAVPNSFGQAIAQAQVGLGESGVKVAGALIEHMGRQKYYRDQEIGDDRGNKLDGFVTDSLYSNEEVDVNFPGTDGKPVATKVQKGYLNRQNHAATGSYQQFQQALEAKKQEDLAALGNNPVAVKRYLERYDSISASSLKTTLTHEATEQRNGSRNTLMETVASKLTQLPMLDETAKANNIASINKDIDEGYAKGLLTFEQVKTQRNNLKWNVFLSDYRVNPTGTEKAFLDGKYEMDAEFNERAITKLNELKRIAKEDNTNNYAQAMSDMFVGKQTFNNVDSLVSSGKITVAQGTDLKNKIISTTDNLIGGKTYESKRKAIDLIMTDSQIDRSVMYQAVLEAHDGDQTTDESTFMHKLIDLKKDKKLRQKLDDGHKQILSWIWNKPKTGKDIETETKSILSLAHKIVDEAKTPDQAFREVVSEDIHREHPATALHPDVEVAYSRNSGMRNIQKVKQEEAKK